MPLRSIVLVVLRYFSVLWFFGAAIFLVAKLLGDGPPIASTITIFLAVALIVGSYVLWILSPRLSGLIVGTYDAPVNVGSLSREDLYAFAFVFLGLYFILSSAAQVANWLYFFIQAEAAPTIPIAQSLSSLYGFTQPLLTLIAGLLCLFPGRRWARKLALKDKETQ
jgi:hypothetical protein